MCLMISLTPSAARRNIMSLSFLSTMPEEMGGGVCPTITGDHQDRITDYTAVVVECTTPPGGTPMNALEKRA